MNEHVVFCLKLIIQFLFRHDPKGKYLQIWPLRTKLILTAVEVSNSELGRKSSFGTVPFRISFKPEESLSGEKSGEVWIAPKSGRILSSLVSMHQRIFTLISLIMLINYTEQGNLASAWAACSLSGVRLQKPECFICSIACLCCVIPKQAVR